MAAYKENLQAIPQKQQSARSTKTQNWFKKIQPGAMSQAQDNTDHTIHWALKFL